MTTVTVSIGRNVGDEPLSPDRWLAFKYAVRSGLGEDATVYVDGAASIGQWQGVSEESATWVADIEETRAALLSRHLAKVALEYGQDAIALTLGETRLVTAE
jgi:hypothetical protein